MRTVDVLICFPDVVIALFLIALFGTGYGTLIAALTITGWTPFARLMRGLALEINAKDYVEAAEILGSPKAYIVFRHVIPNAIAAGARDGVPALRAQADHRRRPVLPRPGRPAARLRLGRDAARRPALHGTRARLGILPGAAIFLTALSVTMIGQGIDVKKRAQARRGSEATPPASRTAARRREKQL